MNGIPTPTLHSVVTSQSFSSKDAVQQVLKSANVQLNWHASGSSELDGVFGLYDKMERSKSYILAGCSLLFWTSLAFDVYGSSVSHMRCRTFLTLSRVTNFLGSIAVFLSVIIVSMPDYIATEILDLDKIVPFCGDKFKNTVKQAAEYSIGLFFACLFTKQLFPILISIVPSLGCCSVLSWHFDSSTE